MVGLAPRTVRFWRGEFLKHGMDIFSRAVEVELSETSTGEPVPVEIETLGQMRPTHTTESGNVPFPSVRKNPGVKPDDSMAEAGRKILRFHFAHMLNHEQGTRLGADIEELHDMRVATRRMRAAFEVFKPFYRKKLVKNLQKGLRATGRALGRVRDLDVLLEKAEHHLETLPEADRPGLDPLLETWQQERASERDKLLAHLDSESYGHFKQEFNIFTSTPDAEVRHSSGTNSRPDLVQHVLPILVYTNLARVRALEGILSSATVEQLHALRIEFKKLRYTLEFFREVLGPQAKGVVEELKAMQDHLGDLNDANVACQLLGKFIENWEERQAELPLHERQNPEPVVAYLAAKHAERYQLMVTFPQAWEHFNRPELMANIALAISVL